MGWETRDRGGRYYTRSIRVGGRVVREYFGAGLRGQAAALQDARERARRMSEREVWNTERRKIESTDSLVEGLFHSVEALTRASLMLAGYHRHHRGQWRKKRGRERE